MLQEYINGSDLKQFLMAKYSWTEETFHTVDWEEYDKQMKAYSIQQRVALTKYTHGWLATKIRRFRENSSGDALCTLCGMEEDRWHLFRCTNDQMSHVWKGQWNKLLAGIGKFTDPGFKQIFCAGLSTVIGNDPPTPHTKQD